MCRYPECPWKDGPHEPWCGEIGHYGHTNVGTDQHKPRKGMGGNNPASKIVAVLCPALHDAVDNGLALGGVRYKDEIRWVDGHKFYRLWAPGDTEHTPEGWSLIWREIPDATAGQVADSEARLPRLSDVSDAGMGVDILPDVQGRRGLDSNLTEWCQRGMDLLYKAKRLDALTTVLAFEVGDWVNEGEAKFGEKASQFTDKFSYWQVAKWSSVARRVPEEVRVLSHDKISFEHHRAIAEIATERPQEAREMLLDAAARGQSAAALSSALRPPERVEAPRRYTIAELLEILDRHCEPCSGCGPVRFFLEGLA